ncbi:MAG: amino acid permease [Gemmatimonadaceae bacterium]|jgi:APA family basic amino acid/polyamine antiporter|nr:amino acid permease [Gemmatimonadaceae bacterium]
MTQSLTRGLGLADAIFLVVGSMIGSGIFLVSAESARLVGAPGLLLLVWALAGVMTITGALCCAELAAMLPKAGGQYVFLREAYGPTTGFVFGWSMLLVIQTGTIAAVAVAFANFLGVLVPGVSSTTYLVAPIALGARYAVSVSTQQLVAVLLILLLTAANWRGLALARRIQQLFTVTKTLALAALIVIGLGMGWNASAAAFTSAWMDATRNGWSAVTAMPTMTATGTAAVLMLLGRAMVGPLFAQSAWNNVTFAAGEVRDPGRNLPRALLVGCAVVVTLYLLANVAYVVTLPLEAIQKAPQNRVATAAMQAVFGAPGAVAMAIGIMIATFGANNGLILAGARVSYAMARDGLFFAPVARLNTAGVPGVALLAQGVWAALLTLPRTRAVDATTGAVTYGNVYTQLLEYIIPADLVLYGLMVYAVVVLRRRLPDTPRPYRTWGYPVTPTIYLVLAAALVIDLGVLAPATSGIGYLLVLSGVPVYWVWGRRG